MKNFKSTIASWLGNFCNKLFEQILDKIAFKLLTIAALSLVELLAGEEQNNQIAQMLETVIAYTA
ncbi:hypothetical protein [Vibrio bivalvicida]|uniref:Uncharacterized protein n=1 Tax=Vibrio bivalvicida TaxID=1276888 RepID=A0A177Y2W0_9VIBR|nr:hypothetical protein [Vibrio bivalvicida]OAJ95223.1 hypothetical protein APB76_08040 [Vibrio bivalvicida]